MSEMSIESMSEPDALVQMTDLILDDSLADQCLNIEQYRSSLMSQLLIVLVKEIL